MKSADNYFDKHRKALIIKKSTIPTKSNAIRSTSSI